MPIECLLRGRDEPKQAAVSAFPEPGWAAWLGCWMLREAYRTTQTDTEVISAHRGMLSATAKAMPRAGMKAIFFI